MKATLTMETNQSLVLAAETAADLMMTQVVSVREDALLREALTLLIDKGISAAPAINEAGRPVGVLSRSDLLIHDRETVETLQKAPEYYHREDLKAPTGEALGRGFQVEKVDRTRVRDVMTPVVFYVNTDTPAARVVNDMLAWGVHRLFVVDESGVLLGVISAMDVLRHLRP